MAFPSDKQVTHWTQYETNAVINIWNEHRYELQRVKRNKHIYAKIAEKLLTRHNISHSIFEIKNKIDNLNKVYRKEKRKIVTGSSRVTWRYFDQMDVILGSNPCPNNASIENGTINLQDIEVMKVEMTVDGDHIIAVPPTPENNICDASTQRTVLPPEDFSGSEASSSSVVRRRPKRRKMNHDNELVTVIKQLCDKQLNMDNAMLQHNQATIQILKKQTELHEKGMAIYERMLDLFSEFLKK